MAAKPDITVARFADTGAANVTDPPSGSRDTGFVSGDPADEGVVNALFFRGYEWFQYLDDGDLDGDHSIDGALDVTGALDVGGAAAIGGGLEVVGGPLVLQGIVTRERDEHRPHSTPSVADWNIVGGSSAPTTECAVNPGRPALCWQDVPDSE